MKISNLSTDCRRKTPSIAERWGLPLHSSLAFMLGLLVVGVSAVFVDSASAQSPKKSFFLQPFQWANQEESTAASNSDNLEWPAARAGIPPEIKRRANARVLNRSLGRSQSSVVTDFPSPRQKPRRFSSPFAWTNTTPPAKKPITEKLPGAVRMAALEQSAAGLLPSREDFAHLASPLSWSNKPENVTTPRYLEPPAQRSLSASIQDALQWQESPDDSEKAQLEASRPPKDATDAELVEWEKKKYPWIRPFYWSEDLSESTVPAYEPLRESTLPSNTRSHASVLARPFTWTNEVPGLATQSHGAGDSRTISFLQGNEELPLPPQQLGIPGQPEPAGDSDEKSLAEAGEDEEGTIGGAETLGREPVDTSLQFLRADTVLLDPGQFQFDWGLTYSLFKQSFPILVPTSPTTVGVDVLGFRTREMVVPFEIRYGLARRIQLFANMPFGWSNTELTLAGTEAFENDGGLGDIIFGGTFLLRQGNHETSDVVMTVAATAPTGQDPFAPVVGLAPAPPALGGGTWSLASSMLFVKNYDPVVVFYGFGTRQHFLRKVNGVNFRPGGEYNYTMGVGFAVNEKITFSTRFNGAYISETRLDSERVPGTIREPMTVGLAMTVARCNKLIEPFIDFGLTSDSTDARFGITWTR